MNYVYILKCSDNTFYTGWTNDLKKRLESHNSGKGSKYTRNRLPVQYVYIEEFKDKNEAMRKEYLIKRLSKKEKIKLVESISLEKYSWIYDNLIRRVNMEELKIYRCKLCGNIAVKLHDSKVPLVCCGEEMELLEANTTDASGEKHVPVVTRENNRINVNVGSVDHPMVPEHWIQFIILQTESGYRVAFLNPGDKPSVDFYDDEPVFAVYEYCNLHGLWKTAV